MTTYFAFAAFVAVIVLSPGPNLFLLLKNTPTQGRRAGLLNTAGLALAVMFQVTLSLVGVGAIMLASAATCNVFTLIGSAYLIYLGCMALREAWRVVPATSQMENVAQLAVVWDHRAIAEGWLTGVLNPKQSMFYLAAFPKFLDPAGPMLLEGHSLGALHATFALAWYSFVVLALERVRGYIRRPAVARTIAVLSGIVLVAFGVRLATLRISLG